MQFGSYVDTCSVCRGAKIIQILEERRDDGNWVRNDMLSVALWDLALAALPNDLRLNDAPCFSCAGAGQVEYESVGCKIF